MDITAVLTKVVRDPDVQVKAQQKRLDERANEGIELRQLVHSALLRIERFANNRKPRKLPKLLARVLWSLPLDPIQIPSAGI
jgi:hypothetical protein